MIKTLSLILLLAATQMQAVLEIKPAPNTSSHCVDIGGGRLIPKEMLFARACLDGDVILIKTLLNMGIDPNLNFRVLHGQMTQCCALKELTHALVQKKAALDLLKC